jgi:hypothetical protein
VFIIGYREVYEKLTPDERQAFGFGAPEFDPSKYPESREPKFLREPWIAQAIELAKIKIASRDRQPNVDAKEKEKQPMADKEAIQKAIDDGGNTIVGGVEDITNLISGDAGKTLFERVEAETEKAIVLSNIETPEEYVAASEHRKFLKRLIDKEGNPSDPSRSRIRVVVTLVDASGSSVSYAVETTVGKESLEDFFKPLSDVFNKFHKAVTGARGVIERRIEASRSILEESVIKWENVQIEKKRIAEARQAEINKQTDRTQRARHWIEQLYAHGYTVETCQAILDNDLGSVTEAEIATLENLLREKLVEQETRKRDKELAEAIQTAKSMGLSAVVAELEEQKSDPIVVEAPEPAPVAVPVESAVVQSMVPDIKGQRRKKDYIITITDPMKIPAEFLLPPPAKLYDPDAYPRLKAEARTKGLLMKVPGVKVEEKSKLSQR